MSTMASPFTSLTIVYSIVYSALACFIACQACIPDLQTRRKQKATQFDYITPTTTKHFSEFLKIFNNLPPTGILLLEYVGYTWLLMCEKSEKNSVYGSWRQHSA